MGAMHLHRRKNRFGALPTVAQHRLMEHRQPDRVRVPWGLRQAIDVYRKALQLWRRRCAHKSNSTPNCFYNITRAGSLRPRRRARFRRLRTRESWTIIRPYNVPMSANPDVVVIGGGPAGSTVST